MTSTKVSSEAIIVKLQSAFTHHQQGKLAEAELQYREILQVQPDHFEALRLLATIVLQRKNFSEAVALFEQALKINDKHHGLLNNYGLALKELKRFDEALENYDKAIALQPDNTEAHANRSMVLLELKRNKEKTDFYIASVVQVKSWLRSIESMPVESQRKIQEKLLCDLFRHAWQYSDWWRKRLLQAGYIHDHENLSAFSVLDKIAPLLRTDVQQHFESLRAWRSDWSASDIVTSTTSGSTGIPVRVEKLRDAYNLIYEAVGLVDHEWHQRDSRLPLAIISTDPDSIQPHWGSLLLAILGSGGPVTHRFSFSRSSVEHATWLIENHPAYLRCSPRLVAEIGKVLLSQGNVLPLRQIISQSERVTPQQREICRRAFGGAKIVDRYSCEEVGWLAIQCPKHDHLHVMTGTTIIEIVDDHLRPCPAGVAGRVLVTNLHSFAMPIIRYDIGDIAEWGEECDCGIKLPVIRRLWGRKRNLMMLPNGETRPMYFLGIDVAEIKAIKEYRVVQQKNGEIDFFVRVDHPLIEEENSKLLSLIYKVDTQLVVHIHEVHFIDWGDGLKREEFVRLET
jgi:phenylacetate-CoA ligase